MHLAGCGKTLGKRRRIDTRWQQHTQLRRDLDCPEAQFRSGGSY